MIEGPNGFSVIPLNAWEEVNKDGQTTFNGDLAIAATDETSLQQGCEFIETLIEQSGGIVAGSHRLNEDEGKRLFGGNPRIKGKYDNVEPDFSYLTDPLGFGTQPPADPGAN